MAVIMCRRDQLKLLEKKVNYYRKQVEELEYSLKVLVETGTVIPQQLDDEITRVLSGQSLLDLEETYFHGFPICFKHFQRDHPFVRLC